MKKILINLLIVINLYSEHNYNLSISNWFLSEKNKINVFTMGSNLELKLKDRIGYFGEIGSIYLREKNAYHFGWGIYLEIGIKLKRKIQNNFSLYLYTSIKNTYFLSRFLQFTNIPKLKDELFSYKIGTGINFNNYYFLEYNFELINNYKSNFGKKDKIYVNNLKLGIRAY